MEIKKNNKTLLTGNKICFAAGIILAVCGIYWIVQAIAFNNTHFPELLISVFVSLFLITRGIKRR
ncbi:MAG: hypothetical protein K2I69_07185 [Muribaculaceae bacterium]|nr:hypothetical protein [Muribaculaceae bacterium]